MDNVLYYNSAMQSRRPMKIKISKKLLNSVERMYFLYVAMMEIQLL